MNKHLDRSNLLSIDVVDKKKFDDGTKYDVIRYTDFNGQTGIRCTKSIKFIEILQKKANGLICGHIMKADVRNRKFGSVLGLAWYS